jgi:hypothetical protein
MANEFDQQIAALEAEIAAYDSKLREARHCFVEAAGVFLKDWCVKELERQVKQKAATTTALGLERVRALKADVARLAERMPQEAATVLNDPNHWKVGSIGNGQFPYSGRKPLALERAVCLVAGTLYQLLRPAGYLTDGDWLDTAGRNAPRIRLCPDSALGGWSEPMVRAVSQYNSLAADQMSRYIGLEQVKGKKTAAAADDIWNRA